MDPAALLDGLTAGQALAVTTDAAPLCIVAGAGSGKTRVLTRRVAFLVAVQGASPYSVLAITFTNKAADEMKARVAALVGPVAEKMWVCTFHSACVRMLRRDAARLGYKPSFTIYDQADAVRLTGYILRDAGVDAKRFPPRAVHAVISQAKNDLVTADAYHDRATGAYERRIAGIYREYQARLLAASAFDFDDLLVQAVELMRRCPDVLEHYQARFRHLLVDEYQDTNAAQNALVLLLGRRHRNVCVVGDSDQSVYRFRGADIRNLLEFESAFPDARVVVLEQNYRSTQTILDAANAVIAHNAQRRPKTLWTDQAGGEPIVALRAADEHDEAAWVVREIGRLHDEEGLRWGDVAAFYRTNAQSRVIEEELVRRNIPYRVVGGPRFYDRKEVKDLLAYLRAVANPADEVSLKRVVNVPRRGVGDTSMGRLDAWARASGVPFGDALQSAEGAGVTGRALHGVRELLELLEGLRADAAEGAGPATLLERILDRTGYQAELDAERTVEAAGRIENVNELVGTARNYDDLDAFLEAVSLVADTDEASLDDSSVVLMTLHTAKGLEFPAVFMVGMEDGVFPHLRSLGEPAELEEERRLCYVGITRACHRLYLTNAVSRSLWGSTQYNLPSRFLKEVPGPLMVTAGGSAPSRFGGRPGLVEWAQRGAGSRRPAAARNKGADTLGLRAGDDVVHPKFGEGVILQIIGSGDKAEAVVRFPGVGEKRLLLSWAPLKRA
ncbi:MAG: DNA helicase PcrA [Acidimicrobiales bacterium]